MLVIVLQDPGKCPVSHFPLLPLNFNAGVPIDIHYSSDLEFLTTVCWRLFCI